MKYSLTAVFFALVLLLVSVSTSVSVPKKSSEPYFSDVTVTTSSSHLLLFGMLENSFSDEMEQGLHSGIPVLFSFFIELNPTNSNAKEVPLVSIETHHLLNYDTLKETYRVELEESGKRHFSFSTLEEAKKVVNEINGLRIIELNRIRPNVSYTVRLRAELYKKTLPLGLHRVVPFISWWDITTRWHSLTFTL